MARIIAASAATSCFEVDLGAVGAGLAPDLGLTCSIGVTMSRAGEEVADMLQRADAALYRAKSAGRNVVCVG